MKKAIKIIGVLLVIILVVLFITRFVARKKLKFEDETVSVIFSVKKNNDYTISQERSDLRTSREDAIILGDTFKIGIEIKDDLSLKKYSGDFEKYKEIYKEKEEFKEVTYSGIKGFQRYYEPYIRYEVFLPIEGSNKYFVKLDIYSKENTKETAKEQLESSKVKDILNNITIKSK